MDTARQSLSFAWKAPICMRQLARSFFFLFFSSGTRLVQTGMLVLGWAVRHPGFITELCAQGMWIIVSISLGLLNTSLSLVDYGIFSGAESSDPSPEWGACLHSAGSLMQFLQADKETPKRKKRVWEGAERDRGPPQAAILCLEDHAIKVTGRWENVLENGIPTNPHQKLHVSIWMRSVFS